MLVLTRKVGQSIILNQNIEVIVTAVDGDQVKIGIRAPREVQILRKEVMEAVQNANLESKAGQTERDKLKKLLGKKE